jgi:beta-lactamase superfamily II metal-dependent hydrolase
MVIGEEAFIDRDTRVDFQRAGATTPEVVASAKPQFAIISVGSGNSFGLPRTEVLGRLGDAGTRVYRTDLHGAVTFYLDGDSVTPSVAALQ